MYTLSPVQLEKAARDAADEAAWLEHQAEMNEAWWEAISRNDR